MANKNRRQFLQQSVTGVVAASVAAAGRATAVRRVAGSRRRARTGASASA